MAAICTCREAFQGANGRYRYGIPEVHHLESSPVSNLRPGALYHVTARGDRREPIYEDDEDRQAFLDVLADVADRASNRPRLVGARLT